MFSPQVLWMRLYLALQMAALVFFGGWFLLRIIGVELKTLFILVPLFIVWLPGVHLMIPWYDCDSLFFGFLSLFCLGAGFRLARGNKHGLLLILAGACGGLSFLSKQNVGGASVVAALAFIVFQGAGIKAKSVRLFLFALGAGIPLCFTAFYFIHHDAQKDAVQWIFLRSAQRHGEGHLLKVMMESFVRILIGPINHFLKFLLVFYLAALVVSWKEMRSDPWGRFVSGRLCFRFWPWGSRSCISTACTIRSIKFISRSFAEFCFLAGLIPRLPSRTMSKNLHLFFSCVQLCS
jgi:hypothetical protein